MVKRRETGVVSRLLRQTSCLFNEIPPRSLKTEFKCHLRLSNGHRAGGDPSKRLSDKRPLLNMAHTAGKVRLWACELKSAPHWRAREPQEPESSRDRGPKTCSGVRDRELEWGARVRGPGCNTTSYLPPQHAVSPIPRASA